MFRGTFYHNVDEKGRVAIPRKFRETLLANQGDSRVVLTRSADRSAKCLDIYPEGEWRRLEDRIRERPQFGAKTRAFKTLYIASAHEFSLDAQGRILVPAELRERIGLTREAAFTGDLEKFLLWSKPEWEHWQGQNESAAAEPGYFDELAL